MGLLCLDMKPPRRIVILKAMKKPTKWPWALSKLFLFPLALGFTLGSAQAIEFEDAIFPELATSARALGMGNAFLSKVDDASAAFYNPAGLGTVRKSHFHISNFHLEMNKGFLTTGSSGPVVDALKNTTKLFSLEGTRELLKDNPGKIAHSRFHVLPNLTARYFSLGYLLSKHTRAVVTDPLDTEGFEFADRLDHGPYVAFNFSFFGGVFKVGASTVYLNRNELKASVDPSQTLNVDDQYQKGNAFITTLGTKLTLPVVFLPTFSATVHNALDQEFKNGRGAGVPEKIKRTIDVGFSITPQMSTRTRVHFEVNYKDLSKEFETVQSARRILAGIEFDYARAMFVRFGYGDGFGSFGIGARTNKFEFDISTYAVDTSSSTFRGEEDRRFALSLSSGF